MGRSAAACREACDLTRRPIPRAFSWTSGPTTQASTHAHLHTHAQTHTHTPTHPHTHPRVRTHACSGLEVADCSDGPSHSNLHLIYDVTRQASRAHAARMRLNASPLRSPPVPLPLPCLAKRVGCTLMRERCIRPPPLQRATALHGLAVKMQHAGIACCAHARTQHGQRARHGGHGRARGDDTVMHAALAGTDARACTHGRAQANACLHARAHMHAQTAHCWSTSPV